MRLGETTQFRAEGLLFLLFGLVFAPILLGSLILDLVEREDELVYETQLARAQGALHFIGERQRTTLVDYSLWNDMYRATVLGHDDAWYQVNLGASVGSVEAGKATLVIDGAMHPVMGSWENEPVAWNPSEEFGAQFPVLFARVIDATVEGTSDEGVSGFARRGDEVFSISIAPIAPHEDSLPADPMAPPRFLVFAEALDADRMAALGRSLSWPDLDLVVEDGGTGPSLPVLAEDGSVIGHLAWRAPGVSRQALRSRWPVILAGLGMLALATLGLHWRMRQAVRRMGAAEREARWLADVDPLTAIGNRRHFAATGAAIAGAGGAMQAMIVDLDGFKAVNDRLGHRTGDVLLVEVTRRLQAMLPPGALLARLGGDEFGLLVTLRDEAAAAEFGADLALALASPFTLEGKVVRIGASIGVAGSSGDVAFEELVRRADVAMYAAKLERSGLCRAYHAALEQEQRLAAALDAEMRDGLAAGEFHVAYQPLVAVEGGMVTGVEALLRWNHSERGPVSPNLFIPIAERSRFIIELGDFVLRAACREMMASGLDLSLSVNLSPVQLTEPRLCERVAGILAETGLPPHRLELEVTETCLIEQRQEGIALLERLRALGIRISLDDFGCGYASIGHLRNLPVDRVKIDRSFVAPIDADPVSRAVLAAVIDLCRALGKSITAEGVETEVQAAFLATAGCDRLQGFLFARPGSLDAAAEVAATTRRRA